MAPPRKTFLDQWLDSRIETLFGRTPEEFKKYLRRKWLTQQLTLNLAGHSLT